jgi:hypothetical protein
VYKNKEPASACAGFAASAATTFSTTYNE